MSKRPFIDLTRDEPASRRRRIEPYPPPAPRKWPPAEPETTPAERLADYLRVLEKWGDHTGNSMVKMRLEAQPEAHRALQQLLRDDTSLSQESIWANLAFDKVTRSFGLESSDRPEDVIEEIRKDFEYFKRQYSHESPSTRADRWLIRHLAYDSDLIEFAEQLRLARLYKNAYDPPPRWTLERNVRAADICRWARQPRPVQDIAFDYAIEKPVKFWGTHRP